MKLGQFIECNMKNIFFEKSYTKYGGEISPRIFSKKKTKMSIFQNLNFSLNIYTFILLYVQVEDYQNIFKLSTEHLLLSHLKLLKNEKEV